MSECKALMVNRGEDKSISHQIETIQIADLPADGDVLVAAKLTVNYKDGQVRRQGGGVHLSSYSGLDFAGSGRCKTLCPQTRSL